MPAMVAGRPYQTVVMIAEKAADYILSQNKT